MTTTLAHNVEPIRAAEPVTVTGLIDSAHGVYIPQIFARDFATTAWGLSQKQTEILLEGPSPADGADKLYWDTWGVVLNSANWRDGEGNVWRLYQDNGALFAAMYQEAAQ